MTSKITPLTVEREQEIRDNIPTAYGPPWTVHPNMDDSTWRVMYATDHPPAGLVCEVPDYGAHLAEFIAGARAAVPELLDELHRVRAQATVAADLAERWEKEATGTQRAIDASPLGGEVEAAQHERVHTYRQAARDLRRVLETGQTPDDLLTAADRAAVETGE